MSLNVCMTGAVGGYFGDIFCRLSIGTSLRLEKKSRIMASYGTAQALHGDFKSTAMDARAEEYMFDAFRLGSTVVRNTTTIRI
jgi:hypothetical protein